MYRYLVNFSFWSLNYISTLVQKKKNFDKITTTRKGGWLGIMQFSGTRYPHVFYISQYNSLLSAFLVTSLHIRLPFDSY